MIIKDKDNKEMKMLVSLFETSKYRKKLLEEAILLVHFISSFTFYFYLFHQDSGELFYLDYTFAFV